MAGGASGGPGGWRGRAVGPGGAAAAAGGVAVAGGAAGAVAAAAAASCRRARPATRSRAAGGAARWRAGCRLSGPSPSSTCRLPAARTACRSFVHRTQRDNCRSLTWTRARRAYRDTRNRAAQRLRALWRLGDTAARARARPRPSGRANQRAPPPSRRPPATRAEPRRPPEPEPLHF